MKILTIAVMVTTAFRALAVEPSGKPLGTNAEYSDVTSVDPGFITDFTVKPKYNKEKGRVLFQIQGNIRSNPGGQDRVLVERIFGDFRSTNTFLVRPVRTPPPNDVLVGSVNTPFALEVDESNLNRTTFTFLVVNYGNASTPGATNVITINTSDQPLPFPGTR